MWLSSFISPVDGTLKGIISLLLSGPVITMRKYSKYPKVPILELYHQIQFSVIHRTQIGNGVLPVCWGAVSVYSSSSRENTHTCSYIHIYIYIYICVYVCVYIYIYIYISKVGDRCRGLIESSLFNSYYTKMSERALFLSLDCPYLRLKRTL